MNIEELKASTANVLTVAQLLTVLEALDGEQLDARTVRRACEDGQLPSIRVGRRILIPRLPLIALLDGGTSSPGDQAAAKTDGSAGPPQAERAGDLGKQRASRAVSPIAGPV